MPVIQNSLSEKCSFGGVVLLEINKDERPEYLNHGDFEGFKHRYVCKKRGHEATYNTINKEGGEIPENSTVHYGKKGNKMLYRANERYLKWINENWRGIKEDYIDYCRLAGQLDTEEFEAIEKWVSSLAKEAVFLHLRQFSDEISNLGYGLSSNLMSSIELLMLIDRLEEIYV
jgi:hypothetical protein